MGSWRTRASAASVAGAFVFAAVAGAGAIFVGDWWGSHHAPVVTEFVTTPASPVTGSQSAIARSARPAATVHRGSAPARGQAQADAKTARVAGTSPAVPAHPPAGPAAPAQAGPGPATVPPASPPATPSTPAASGAGSAPSSTPSSTDSPGTNSSASRN
jgi:hypothetical protein